MSNIVVIHQPDFIPYLGFFHRFLFANLYVVLDHVQFVYGSRAWTHRDKIKTPKGTQWLTISVKRPRRDTPINQVRLSDDVDWRTDHLRLIETNYVNAKFFDQIMPHVRALYAEPTDLLIEFNLRSIKMLMSLLDLEIPIIMSSSLSPRGTKNELLLDLLKKLGAKGYLAGIGSRAYMDESLFDSSGIQLLWQNFTHPIYPQQFGEFQPNLSAIDMLFNCGINVSRRLLRADQ